MKKLQIKIPKKNLRKKSKETSEKKVKKNRSTKSRNKVFGIRNKIIVCFLVPIVFMVIVGVSAYNKASEGMTEKFKETSVETIKMMREYIDMTNSFIKSEGMKYGASDNISDYCSGKYIYSDMTKHAELSKNIQSEITAAQMTNSFIQDIHIITPKGINILSTHITGKDGIYDEYMEEMAQDGKNYATWVDAHNVLDAHLKQTDDEYILSYQLQHYSGNAMIVVDVKEEEIRTALSEIDLGAGSIVGMVTAQGKEIVCENESSILQEGEPAFFGQEFYKTAYDNAEIMEDATVVDYMGQEHM